MCGRFSLDRFPESVIAALIDAEIEFSPRPEVCPADRVDVVFRGDTSNEIASMQWGWMRSFSSKPLINARSAGAWEKKTWAQALRERRCIIPASGFFEWDENQPQGRRDKYRIEPMDRDGFAFAGLYEISTKGEMFMSILTTTPSPKLSRIHHRMPVILNQDCYTGWLESGDRKLLEPMMRPLPDSQLRLTREKKEPDLFSM